jgi:hypothetical protein
MHGKNYFYLRNFTGSRLIREILHENDQSGDIYWKITNPGSSIGKLLRKQLSDDFVKKMTYPRTFTL